MSLFFVLNHLIKLLFILLVVAFYTLLERKVLSYSQARKGPNFVSLSGVLQALADALKMMLKSNFFLLSHNFFIYNYAPFLSFFLMTVSWLFFLDVSGGVESPFTLLFFICLLSLLTYGQIFSGWSSNSKYSMIGSLRGVAQSISYELIIFLGFFLFFCLYKTYSFDYLKNPFFMFFCFFVYVLMLVSFVCELNRAPFDLSEGESELVSGFNVEYGGLKFALIFLSEYGMMVFMSFIMGLLVSFSFISLVISLVMFMTVIIIMRSSYPRLRFDFLMIMTWKQISVFLFLGIFFFVLIV